MDEPEDGEDTYGVQVKGSAFRRAADQAVNYKLGQLSSSYAAISKQIDHNEEEAQRQWGLLHAEIGDLRDTFEQKLEKLEDAYKKVITWMAGISAAITVAVWFVEHVILH